MRHEAFVTPAVIKWARASQDLSLEQLAKKATVNPKQIETWEEGTQRPTFRQAMRLAAQLRIPFGYLFLREPPQLEVSIPDLRTVDSVARDELSADLRDTLDDATIKQDWYRQYLQAEGAEKLAFVGRYTEADSSSTIADDIRRTLGLEALIGKRRPSKASDYLRFLVNAAEDVGVTVLKNSGVRNNTSRHLEVEEFRGFALVDELAPLVFINGADAATGQIFTLIHELGHLWIGQQGISNLRFRAPGSTARIETLCNAVAGQVLVPEPELGSVWQEEADPEANLETARDYFTVSGFVVLFRAKDTGKITPAQFQKLLSLERARTKKPKTPRGGGSFYKTLPYRNGRNLTRAVLGAAMDGNLSLSDAASLLNVRPAKLEAAAVDQGLLTRSKHSTD